MINSDEILQNLGSIVIVKKNDEIVYTNTSIDLSCLKKNRGASKIVKANDGLEYEIITYPSPQIKHYDSLTGLYSKGTFIAEANIYYNSTLSSGEQFCTVFMDLDNFKLINNTYGHLTADKILKIVGNCIKKNIRSTDLCSRFGGDEFVILLKSASEDVSLRIVEAIKKRIISVNEELDCVTNELKIGASFGIASSKTGSSLESIINNSDMALYIAKQNRGSIKIFDRGRSI